MAEKQGVNKIALSIGVVALVFFCWIAFKITSFADKVTSSYKHSGMTSAVLAEWNHYAEGIVREIDEEKRVFVEPSFVFLHQRTDYTEKGPAKFEAPSPSIKFTVYTPREQTDQFKPLDEGIKRYEALLEPLSDKMAEINPAYKGHYEVTVNLFVDDVHERFEKWEKKLLQQNQVSAPKRGKKEMIEKR